ncbi:MAG: hypothetical protein RI935_601 [Candidatus Parcubacteria bacterium]
MAISRSLRGEVVPIPTYPPLTAKVVVPEVTRFVPVALTKVRLVVVALAAVRLVNTEVTAFKRVEKKLVEVAEVAVSPLVTSWLVVRLVADALLKLACPVTVVEENVGVSVSVYVTTPAEVVAITRLELVDDARKV